jgi:hypothetical protein
MYCVYKIIAGDAVLCLMPVGNDTVCAWHVCGGAQKLNQCPYWCPTYMTLFWYVLSTYQYVLICTIIHVLYRYVPSRYQYVPVRTKYPVPVIRFTIPDE